MAGLVTGIVGLGIGLGTTAASFIQAGNQKRKQQDYEADAARALDEARRKLQVNYAEAMSVNKEPYNQERLFMLSAGAQIAAAAAESKRGVSAAAGQILASQQAAQNDISNRQGVDMQNIQNAILEEESRLRDVNVGLDMQEVAGQQQAAADARLASQMATQQGIQGIANTAQSALKLVPLYLKTRGTRIPSDALTQLPTPTQKIATGDISKPMETPQTLIQTKQEVLRESTFTSPEQAAVLGYEYDDVLKGYVKKTTTNENIPAPKTYNSNNNSYDAFNYKLEGKR